MKKIVLNACGVKSLGGLKLFLESFDFFSKTDSKIIAAACPFCNTMLTDGIKSYENENDIEIKDISELVDKVTD